MFQKFEIRIGCSYEVNEIFACLKCPECILFSKDELPFGDHALENHPKVLYMSFDRFLLAVESRDLSQANKILIIRSSVVKLSSLVNTFFWKTFVHSGPNFLQNEFSQSSQIYLSPEKLRQMFTFSNVQKFNFWMVKFTVIPKKLFGTWQFGKIGVLVNFIIQKFARLKS